MKRDSPHTPSNAVPQRQMSHHTLKWQENWSLEKPAAVLLLDRWAAFWYYQLGGRQWLTK